jgi:regulator of replication initiation timing
MEFKTGKAAKDYLNKECGLHTVVLQTLNADESKVAAQIAYQSPEMGKLLKAYSDHIRKLGETNKQLNRENFSLGMRLSKFAQDNLPTFVKIAGNAMEFFAGLAIMQHERAQSIQAESVQLYTEIADDAEAQIAEYQRRVDQLDHEYQQLKAENQKLMAENKKLKTLAS